MEQNNTTINGSSVVNNMLWRLAERFGAQGVNFIVSVVLARILAPEDYGVVALTTTITTILNVFVTSGLGKALIQKAELDELDYSTALIANVGIGAVLYGFMYLAAPFIADFYHQEQLTSLLRVLSLSLVIGGINSIQHAKIGRAMKFKIFFKAALSGTIVSAFIGIGMALKGFGSWALVGQSLSKQIVDTLFLWAVIKWNPRVGFSWIRFKPLFSYGWRAYGADMIETLYNSLRSLLIGKYYSSADLAFYNRGRHIPSMIDADTSSAIQSVMFPAYSRYADDRVKMKSMMKKALSVGTFIMFPCMMGLAMTSGPMVDVLYTAKWRPAVPFMKIACFVYALNPLHVVNLQAVLAIGRSDISLKVEIFKKTIAVTVMVICVRHSLMAAAISAVPLGIFALIVNACPVGKEINYPLSEQLKDALPALLLSICMGICVWLVGLLPLDSFLLLLLQIVIGGLVYIGMAKITRNKEYSFTRNYVVNMLSNKNKR